MGKRLFRSHRTRMHINRFKTVGILVISLDFIIHSFGVGKVGVGFRYIPLSTIIIRFILPHQINDTQHSQHSQCVYGSFFNRCIIIILDSEFLRPVGPVKHHINLVSP